MRVYLDEPPEWLGWLSELAARLGARPGEALAAALEFLAKKLTSEDRVERSSARASVAALAGERKKLMEEARRRPGSKTRHALYVPTPLWKSVKSLAAEMDAPCYLIAYAAVKLYLAHLENRKA